MNKKRESLTLLYLAIILGLPFFTFSGWVGMLVAPFVLIFSLVFSLFVLHKFHKNIEQDYTWILLLLFVYIMGCLLIYDGGDGPVYLGVETLVSHITGDEQFRIDSLRFLMSKLPDPVLDRGDNLGSAMFFLFFVLNIAYLAKKEKSLKVELKQ